jgi:hypothetical protein
VKISNQVKNMATAGYDNSEEKSYTVTEMPAKSEEMHISAQITENKCVEKEAIEHIKSEET